MRSGIYYVEFSVTTKSFGVGLAVINLGKVNGGDASYLYRGRFDEYAGGARAIIEVSHYRGDLNAVMGPLRQFTLNLSGKTTEDRFELEGGSTSAPGVKIQMIGRKVADLFE